MKPNISATQVRTTVALGAVVLVLLLIDRLTKFWFADWSAQTLIPGWLIIEGVRNTGIAWGWAAPLWFIIPATSVMIVGLVFWSLRLWLVTTVTRPQWPVIGCLWLASAGAVSNLWDRLVYGAVIDWINVPWWSVFNLADCYIVVGLIAVVGLEWWWPSSRQSA